MSSVDTSKVVIDSGGTADTLQVLNDLQLIDGDTDVVVEKVEGKSWIVPPRLKLTFDGALVCEQDIIPDSMQHYIENSRAGAVIKRWAQLGSDNPMVRQQYNFVRRPNFSESYANALGLRLDAPLWQVPFDILEVSVVVTTANVICETGYVLPVPVVLDLPEDPREDQWLATAYLGHTKTSFVGNGLFSEMAMRAIDRDIRGKALQALSTTAPTSGKCTAPACPRDPSTGWLSEYTPDGRLVAAVLGLCRSCATQALESKAPAPPVRPVEW